jgi:core-2/I-Branching enzyme
VVIMSHRGPAQVRRLVERVTAGSNSVAVIHHHPSGSALPVRPSSSVAVIPDPVRCGWGRLSLVQAQRKALGWVAANIPDFSWFLLISGQDYPVQRGGVVSHALRGDELVHGLVQVGGCQVIARRGRCRPGRLPRGRRGTKVLERSPGSGVGSGLSCS